MTKVSTGFAKQKFMDSIGAKLIKANPGKCEILLPFREDLTQQHGFLHGGLIGSIADNASGFAAYSLMGEDYQPLTVEFKINFLRSTKPLDVIARAEVIYAGRTIFHVRSDVLTIGIGEEKLIATALVTIKACKVREI